jgi:nucleoid DNA-binding protein
MSRPLTVPIKDWMIKNLSKEKDISERTIQCVIAHQAESVMKKMRECRSVEFSGFGKFLFNTKKAGKKLVNMVEMEVRMRAIMENESEAPQKRKAMEVRHKVLVGDIELLKRLLDEKKS